MVGRKPGTVNECGIQEMKPQSTNFEFFSRVPHGPHLKRDNIESTYNLRLVWCRRVESGHGPGTINIAAPWPVPIVGRLVSYLVLQATPFAKYLVENRHQ